MPERRRLRPVVTVAAMLAALAAALALTATTASASGASGARAAALPACPRTADYGLVAHPVCVFRSFRDSTYTEPVTGTITAAAPTKVGPNLYELKVTAEYESGFERTCPAGGIPFDQIPCHDPRARVGAVGTYVKGSKTLGPPVGSSYAPRPCPDGASAPCCSDVRCTFRYRVMSTQASGRIVLVFRVLLGAVTKNPQNNLGQAGFEVPIAFTLPKPTAR